MVSLLPDLRYSVVVSFAPPLGTPPLRGSLRLAFSLRSAAPGDLREQPWCGDAELGQSVELRNDVRCVRLVALHILPRNDEPPGKPSWFEVDLRGECIAYITISFGSCLCFLGINDDLLDYRQVLGDARLALGAWSFGFEFLCALGWFSLQAGGVRTGGLLLSFAGSSPCNRSMSSCSSMLSLPPEDAPHEQVDFVAQRFDMVPFRTLTVSHSAANSPAG